MRWYGWVGWAGVGFVGGWEGGWPMWRLILLLLLLLFFFFSLRNPELQAATWFGLIFCAPTARQGILIGPVQRALPSVMREVRVWVGVGGWEGE